MTDPAKKCKSRYYAKMKTSKDHAKVSPAVRNYRLCLNRKKKRW